MCTQTVRFLVTQLASTQHLSKDKFKYVPIQDFKSTDKIDWSKSIAEINQQLYTHYDLTDNEIRFIEQMVKPME